MLPDDGAAQKPPWARFKDMGKVHLQETPRGKTVQISQLTAVQRAAVGSSAPASLPAAVI